MEVEQQGGLNLIDNKTGRDLALTVSLKAMAKGCYLRASTGDGYLWLVELTND